MKIEGIQQSEFEKFYFKKIDFRFNIKIYSFISKSHTFD
jgi:hypothetical protein